MKRKCSNVFINLFYIPLVIISFLGILSRLLDQLSHLSKWSAVVLDFLILLTIIIYIRKVVGCSGSKILILKQYMIKHLKGLVGLILVMIIAWQLYLVFALSGFNMWDPGIIINQAMGKAKFVKDYFSYNPNTLFLMFYEHWVWLAFQKPDIQNLTIILSIINLIIFDSSLFALYKIVRQFCENRKTAIYTLNFSLLLMAITPWYCIPYSDILAFSLSIFTLCILLYLRNNKSISKLIVLGLLFALDYLIKPSLVIVFIAYVIVSLINKFNFNKTKLLDVLIVVVTIFACLFCFNIYKANNSIVKIDNNKALSMIHFADMGIQGNGGYNLSDVLHDYAIKDPQERRKEDIRIWKERFHKMGIVNYQSFLIRKQVINTVDASFNWDKNEIFLTPYKKRSKLTQPAWRLFLKDNATSGYSDALMLFEQLVWGILFFFMLFNVASFDFLSQFLKYTVVGFFVFLLIFEGGTTRYVIQFLPYLLILGGMGLYQFQRFCQIASKNKSI